MKILLAHDGSSQADKAMERAIMIAGKFDAAMTVVSVAPDFCLPSVELSREECENVSRALTAETEAQLKKVTASVSSKGIKAESVLLEGNAADMILETAEELHPDLIVVGSHGKSGAKKFLFGSVSSKVAEHATCDVLIVK